MKKFGQWSNTIIKYIFYFIKVKLIVIAEKLGFYTPSIEHIPKNTPYCYKYKNITDAEQYDKEITLCPYFKDVTKGIKCCTYIGFLGYDLLLTDYCKICEIE